MEIKWQSDVEFEEAVVKSVHTENGGGWSIKRSDGWSFYVPAESPIEPAIGMVARFYGKGIGYAVRGLLLDGQCVFYRTSAEQAKHNDDLSYGKDCVELLSRWDAGQSVWSISLGGLGPGYEQSIQLSGFEVLRILLEMNPDIESMDDAQWKAVAAEISTRATPILEPLGLSGAQWGAAMNLASVFYRNGPSKAIKMASDDRRIQVSKNFPSLKLQ